MILCATCGAPVSGRFCSNCGTAADAGLCPACQTPLSAGARFCHRCGAAAKGARATERRERSAWIVAGTAVLLAVVAVAWRSGSFRPAPAPEMANAGNAGAAPDVATRAPDISAMSPQERFDRLWDRVIRAAENGDSATVRQFSPMALGAYSMLDSTSNDLRFHAALIQLAIGDLPRAQALADTILQMAPGHLFGYVIRGEVAERQNHVDALTKSYRDYLEHYEAELSTGRPEYADHRPILDDFRVRATASGAKR